MSLLGTGAFGVHVSVPLVLEYEEVLLRRRHDLTLTETDVTDFIDYLCRVAGRHEIHFLWRPCLRDPDEEMVLELAVGAGCDAIVTYNKRDSRGVDAFGIALLTSQELLQEIGELS